MRSLAAHGMARGRAVFWGARVLNRPILSCQMQCKLFPVSPEPSARARAMFAVMKRAIDQAVQAQDPTLAYWQAQRVMASLPPGWDAPHRLTYPFIFEVAEGYSAVTFSCTRDFSLCPAVRFSLATRLLADGVEHARHEGTIGGLAILPPPEPRRTGSAMGVQGWHTPMKKKPAS